MTSTPTRMWINQPSALQPCHAGHGTNVLAVDDGNNMARVYFLNGPVESARIPQTCLSPGWRPVTQTMTPEEVAQHLVVLETLTRTDPELIARMTVAIRRVMEGDPYEGMTSEQIAADIRGKANG